MALAAALATCLIAGLAQIRRGRALPSRPTAKPTLQSVPTARSALPRSGEAEPRRRDPRWNKPRHDRRRATSPRRQGSSPHPRLRRRPARAVTPSSALGYGRPVADDQPKPREEHVKKKRKKKEKEEKNSFSKLCRETRSKFFLLLVYLSKLFLGTNFCKNVAGNKKFTKRISVPKIFLGTKE